MAKKSTKLHKKPTSKELTEKMDEGLEDVEKIEADEKKKVEKIPDLTKKKKAPVKKKQDFQKRYRDSTREAQILATKNKKMTEVIDKAGKVKEPTDEELTAEYPEWEDMSDFERKIAKESLTNRRKFDAITEATKDFKEIDAWTSRVDKFVADPETLIQNPELEGKEEEFKFFATKPTRRGINFQDLISSFLYTEDHRPRPKRGRKMFESGTGGESGKDDPGSDKISIEDSIRLRDTNYKKYIQYVRDGKIDHSKI